MVEIPIYLVGRNGVVGSDFINSSPCVALAITDPFSSRTEYVFGMIDTGADDFGVDCELVEKLGAHPIQTELAHGANASQLTTRHLGIFCLEGAAGSLTTSYLSLPLRANRRSFDVILGRALLAQFDLFVESGVFRLIQRLQSI